VDDWSGKPYCISSLYKLTPTYNNKKWPKSRPSELAFLYATVQTLAYISCQLSSWSWECSFYSHCKDQIHQSTKIQDLVFRQGSSLFCMLIVFSIEHHLKPIHHHRFVHQRLKCPPKIFKPTLHSLGSFWLGTLALTTGSLRPKIGGYTVPATSIHPILNLFKLLAQFVLGHCPICLQKE